MKQKDIAVIIIVAAVAGIISYFVANLLFGGEKKYTLKASVVEPISADFNPPSDTYFNKDAINPTKNITIGDSTNATPFKQNQ